MKNAFLILSSILLTVQLMGQQTVSGIIIDDQNEIVIGANVYIEGTYDGSFSDEQGKFQFETTVSGNIRLFVSYIGYEDSVIEGPIEQIQDIQIKLKSTVSELNVVEVNASVFKAGDNSKVSVLKPLDIVTTAGSNGDVIAALQTLPGNQNNPEDGRLFIRGGESRESNIFIDGMRVFSPYTRTIGGTPSRGRYSPMLFKGVSFSTGGYSAAFGQSLSGILDMNTTDNPELTESNISLMSLGLGLGHTQVWEKQSLSVNASYINLGAYNWLLPGRVDWAKPYQGSSGEAVYRYKTKNGLWKSYISAQTGNVALFDKNLNTQERQKIAIRNSDFYMNHTFRSFLNDNTTFFAGFSMGTNQDQLRLDDTGDLERGLSGMHARLGLKKIIKNHFILNFGLDHLQQNDKATSQLLQDSPPSEVSLQRSINAAFIESDYFFSHALAIKLGLRAEYHHLTNQLQVNPRVTLAQKLGKIGQVSLAYGVFNQEIDSELLFHANDLQVERAEHFLFNYSLKTEKNILRLEAYYKDYKDLVQFNGEAQAPSNLSNGGSGFAYGFDVFWRAQNVIKNMDFWISYGWLEHQREYRNFPSRAMPNFSTNHNLSIVTKKWIPDLRSQLGVTYSIASGRPYENPNTEGFLNERSGFFNSLNVSWAYLISQQKILFVSASNVLGFKNEFGNRYANIPNANGYFPGEVIRPNDDQFFFVGFFITLSPDKLKNQLNNL
ncbi:MAG: TonB-dependent receptor [Bacteroidota bacterium]